MNAKRFAIIAGCFLGVLTFWPWLGQPNAYVHWKDRFRTSIPVAFVFGQPCETKYDGYSEFSSGPDCYRFDEERRFKGVWRNEFEGSSFYEGLASLPNAHRNRSEVWLDFSRHAIENGSHKELFPRAPSIAQIEFIGRKTSVSGSYGHFGSYSHFIVVDRVLSMQEIQPALNN